MKEETKAACVIALAIMLIVIVIQYSQTYSGAIEGRVVVVQHRAWPWPHTDITFATYSDDEIERTYGGHLELEIGAFYRIESRASFWHYYRTATHIEKL